METRHNSYPYSLESHLFAVYVEACIVVEFSEANPDEEEFVEQYYIMNEDRIEVLVPFMR